MAACQKSQSNLWSSSMRRELIEQFLSRIEDSKSSSLTLAGTGPNGSSQLPVLAHIGRSRMREMAHINIISGSSISYFIYIAMTEGGFKADGYRQYDKLVRKLHKGTPIRFLKHILSQLYRPSPYFPNIMLKETLDIFLDASFIARPLSTFDANIRFFTYCLKKENLVEISYKSHPEMTVSDICRACFSLPFLHGPFFYNKYQFIDPTFTDGFGRLRRRLFKTSHNHLYLNIKKQEESKNILFVKNEDATFPVLAMFFDFLLLCLGIPNPRVGKTHAANLDALL